MASISFTNALGIHDDAFKLRSQRAGVLANNLANVNTPNFKARDLDFYALLNGQQQQLSKHVDVNTTHNRHIEGQQGSRFFDGLLYRIPNQPAIDGNTVEEQVEHAQYLKNALGFQSSFRFLDSAFKNLKTAVRGEL